MTHSPTPPGSGFQAKRAAARAGNLALRSRPAKRARKSHRILSKARERAILQTLRETAGQALLTLSTLPPSANGLFANKSSGGRTKTPAYRNWIKAGIDELRTEQRAPLVKGPVLVSLVFCRPAKICDLDNRLKATLDLLVEAHVIEDDSKVESIHARWGHLPGVQIGIKGA